MTNQLFGAYLKLSLSTGLLIAAVCALYPLLRKRYAAKWRYALWMLLAVRLLIPFSASLPEKPVQIPVPRQVVTTVEAPQPALPNGNPNQIYLDPASPAPEEKHLAWAVSIPAAIWLGGAALTLLVQLWAYTNFLRALKKGAPQPVSAQTARLWGETANDMCIGKPPAILVSPSVGAPVLCGLARPTVYLPHEGYCQESLALILRHELVHYRRRDMAAKLLLLLVGCVHWFNPLVHLLIRRADSEIEFSCDDEVTCTMDKQHRATYGSTILSTLPRISARPSLLTTRFSGTKATFQQRLKNLFDLDAKRRGAVAMAAVAAVAVLFSGMIAYVPAAAASRGPQNTSIAMEQLTPDQPAYLGQFTLDGGILTVNLTCREGAGMGIGISKTPNLTFPMKEPWAKYIFNEDASHISASFVDLEGTYYLYAVSESEALRNITGNAKVTKVVAGADDDIAQAFQRYAPYGVLYNAKEDTATYNGQRITLFVVRRGSNSFDLCWHDRAKDAGTLYLEGLQDTAGAPTGIAALEESEAREILSGLYGAYEPGTQGPGIVPVPYVMDATQLGREGFSASDLVRPAAPAHIQTWMDQCDRAGLGTYLLQQHTHTGYDTYLYHNNGGRYPWLIEEDNNALVVKLYDNNTQVTGEGYHLMHYQSPVAHESVTILLDGDSLPYTVTTP